jgi:hypothetical protein
MKKILAALALFLPLGAQAGAWTQPLHDTQIITGIQYSDASRSFGSDSRADVPIQFSKASLQSSTEYGMFDYLTLFLNTETVDVHSKQTGLLPVAAIDNAFEGGARMRLFQDFGILSLQASFRSAGAFNFSVSANSDAGGRGEEIRALYGTSFKFLDRDGFFDLEAGERFLSAPRPSETPIDLTLGLHLGETTMLMLQNFNDIGGGNGHPPYTYFRSHKIEFSVVERLTRHFSLQLGGFFSPAGQNALQEQGFGLSLWTKI